MDPDTVAFDPRTGLVPAIVQAPDGRVLMLAWMDREALGRTLAGGRVTFRSRSRDRLWEKGETSGNWLEALAVRADCDRDALLVTARPHGPTCHTGAPTCFEAGEALPGADASSEATATSTRDPEGEPRRSGSDAAADGSLAAALAELEAVIAARDRERPEGSYTARLLEGGVPLAARKLGEEALETCLAAAAGEGEERLAAESADLVYHLVVLWRAAGLDPRRVASALAERRGGRRARGPGAEGGDGG